MRLVKLGIANVDTTVGAVRSNVDACLRFAQEMAAADVTVAVFPEQCVGGYAAEDLVQWRGFVDTQRTELERFASATAKQTPKAATMPPRRRAVVGWLQAKFAMWSPSSRPLFRAARAMPPKPPLLQPPI